MVTLKIRVDADTADSLEQLHLRSGRGKSEIVRDALELLRRQISPAPPMRPGEVMASLIGTWDSGGLNLPERTGERFARILKGKKARKPT